MSRPLTLAFALLALPLAHAQDEGLQRTYLPRLDLRDRDHARLWDEFHRARQREQLDEAAFLLDELCAAAAHPPSRDLLLPQDPPRAGVETYLSLRQRVHTLLAQLDPQDPLHAPFFSLHTRGANAFARSARGHDLAWLFARYPASPAGHDAALRLVQHALEADDLTAAERLLDRLALLHPTTPDLLLARTLLAARRGDAAHVQGSLTALRALAPDHPRLEPTRAAAAALLPSAPPPPNWIPLEAELHEYATAVLPPASALPGGDPEYSPSALARLDDHLVVTNGAAAHILDLQGDLLGSLPHPAEAASTPTPVEVHLTARPAVGGPFVYSPFRLEEWLTPGRRRPTHGDPSFSGHYLSLVAIDPTQRAWAWWDGDPGLHPQPTPLGLHGHPPGWPADGPLLDLLRQGHVLACAADAQRVYVALTVNAEEAELWVFAYRRTLGPDGHLALQPAWTHPTFVLSADSRHTSAESASPHPDLAATLALDPHGRLVLTTDLGVTASLDGHDGALIWLQRSEGGASRPPFPIPEPARFTSSPAGPVALHYLGSKLVGTRAHDAHLLWATSRTEEHRLLTHQGAVLAYGGGLLNVFEAHTGRRLIRTTRMTAGERCTGRAAQWGETVLIPVRRTRANPYLRRFELRRLDDGQVNLRALGIWPVSGETTAANVYPLDDRRLAVVADRRLTILSWRAR